jgi:hypothetical protein
MCGDTCTVCFLWSIIPTLCPHTLSGDFLRQLDLLRALRARCYFCFLHLQYCVCVSSNRGGDRGDTCTVCFFVVNNTDTMSTHTSWRLLAPTGPPPGLKGQMLLLFSLFAILCVGSNRGGDRWGYLHGLFFVVNNADPVSTHTFWRLLAPTAPLLGLASPPGGIFYSFSARVCWFLTCTKICLA